ncbi:MAG: beta-N-acetylhexosaminidase [Defluviitaleaceae bacterium]|nr:beta-N-acetylhexosaminidase [Defluviitaleaceae bacterium]
MLKIFICNDNKEVQSGLKQLAEVGMIEITSDGQPISAVKQNGGLSITRNNSGITIGYSRLAEFFRGISYLIQGVDSISEQSVFENNGYMLDCSRNAVASVPAIKRLIRHMALMGLTTLQLYTEDTYELPEWKYFGYGRGRYTAEEIRDMDNYAQMFGIELIPCVQTLAHLNAALRWSEFADIIDCNDILLAGDEKTYRLIDDMMHQLSSCYATRRVHIGMDEAHMLGLGKYLDKHGYQNRSEIMCNHLARVVEICKKYGLKPMMWSDMFFRLAYNDEYYKAGDEPLSPELMKLMNPDVGLVYWDYYHKDMAHYATMLDRHKSFPNELIFAGGAWKWGGLFPELKWSEDTTRPALAVCREAGLKEVFATGWGDDGAECSAFAILPVLQLYAELGYGNDANKAELTARFKACTGGNWDDFWLLDSPNDTTKTRGDFVNTTKPLLYQDIMLGLIDKHVDADTFPAHFEKCANELTEAATRNGDWGYMFAHAAALCRVLARKCTMGLDMTQAYLNDDKDELRRLADTEVSNLLKLTADLMQTFEKQWLTENKPFGLEVIQIRVGAIRTRLEATTRRINSYLVGEVEKLEELEYERLGFHGDIAEGADINAHCNLWQQIVTPSRLSW